MQFDNWLSFIRESANINSICAGISGSGRSVFTINFALSFPFNMNWFLSLFIDSTKNLLFKKPLV